MTKSIRFSSQLRCLLTSTILSLAIAVVGAVTPVHAVQTLPVMVDYLDTAGSGATIPQGVACITSGSLAGNFAVVDSTAAEVFILDPKGVLKGQFDTAGFSTTPTGITYISSGAYGGDFAIVNNGTSSTTDKIFVVNSSGVEQHQCNTSLFGSSIPQGITFIPSGPFTGNLAVVDSSADEVFIVDFDCNLIDHFDTSGFSGSPYDIAYDSARDFFAVLDGATGFIVTLTDTSGTVQDDFGVQFVAGTPRGICYMPTTGNYAVVDDSKNEVFIINIESQFLSSFNTAIFGATDPVDLTYIPTTGNYAIVDNDGDEVYFVTPAGVKQDQCDISAFSNDVKGITFLPSGPFAGNFAIVDSSDLEVYFIDSACNLLGQFDIQTFGTSSLSPTGIAYVAATGDLAIADSNRDAVLYVNLSRPGRLKGQLSTSAVESTSPTGLTFFPAATGQFAVVDNFFDEVFILNRSGSLMARFDTGSVLQSSNPQGIAFNPTAQTLAIVDSNSTAVNIVSFPSLLYLPEFCDCDLNKDGKCNILDYQRFIQDWGATDCP